MIGINNAAIIIKTTMKKVKKLFAPPKTIPIKEMRPLATNQLMMTWLSMYPADKSATPRQKQLYIAHTLVVLISNVASCVSSLVYCLKFISTDFDSATFAFMCTIGIFGVIFFMITAISMRHQIEKIFTNLTTIYKSCKWLKQRVNLPGHNILMKLIIYAQMKMMRNTAFWLKRTTEVNGCGQFTSSSPHLYLPIIQQRLYSL